MWLSPSCAIVLPTALELDDLQEFVDLQEWNFEDEQLASEDAPYHIVWMTLDRRTRIRYVDDEWLNVRYFYFSGREATAFAEAARRFFGPPDREELLAAIPDLSDAGARPNETEPSAHATTSEGSTIDRYRRALALCAIASRDADERLLAHFSRGLGAANPELRYATLQAMGYAAWPELEPLFEATRNDEDAEVAELASDLLAALREDRAERF